MDDRRYRQSGYRKGARQESRETPRPPGPPAMFKNRALSRCAECGAPLPVAADSLIQCPNCRAELHTCRQCGHFDPGQRFECARPVPERIADKRARNACGLFSLLVTVERDTSSGSVRPDDARRGFDNLFQK